MFVIKEPRWVIRKIASVDQIRKIYLTFDDGPNSDTTADVLNIFKKHNCTATFFVIGNKAKTYPDIVHRMVAEGHSVLSHSADHNYSQYFQSSEKMKIWMQASVEELNKLTSKADIGFRPPAGILNPPLIQASRVLRMPLILWNYRFFDTVFTLTRKKVDKFLKHAKAGDIILLHDQQKPKNKDLFLASLDHMISELIKLNFQVSHLSQADIKSAATF